MGKDTYSRMSQEEKDAYKARCHANRKKRAAKAAEKGEQLFCSRAGTTKPLGDFTETMRSRLMHPRNYGSDMDAVKFKADATPKELLKLIKQHKIKIPTVTDTGLEYHRSNWASKSQAERDVQYDRKNAARYHSYMLCPRTLRHSASTSKMQ
jgi:hypothetical protein